MRRPGLPTSLHQRRLTTGHKPDRSGAFARIGRTLALSLSMALAGLAATPAQSQTFNDIGAGLDPVHHCTSAWVDFDNDGDLDIFLHGQTNGLSYITRLYENTGSGFNLITGHGLPALGSSNSITRSAWGDFDNDGYVDVLMSGMDNSTIPALPSTRLYRNNGNNTFSQVTVTPAFENVVMGAAAWGDYDNDGDLDVMVAGFKYWSDRVATVYRNDGSNGLGGWNFTDIDPVNTINPSLNYFTRVMNSEGAWGDYDGDGDMDLIITGNTGTGSGAFTRLYRNDGGLLVNSNVTGLPNVGYGYTAWGDYDNDGDLDLAMIGTGYSTSTYYIFGVYRNNMNGSFTQVWAPGGGFSNGSIAWADYNNDGNLDLVVTGAYIGNTPYTLLHYGDGAGGFTWDVNAGFDDLYEGQAVWGDYNNDGKVDVLLSGRDIPSNSVATKVFENSSPTANTAPVKPSVLLSTGSTPTSISFRWLPGSDAETDVATLSYNISVTETISGNIVMPPMADASTGDRRVPEFGNANHQTAWSIGGLQPNTSYTVCVQTIDQGLMASDFRCVNITTTTDGPDMMIGDCSGDVGAEPNGACGSVYWNSPNIWVRRNLDGITTHQSPMAGQDNYIYVRLKNIGTNILPEGTVQVYFTKGTTSSLWPYNWVGFYNSTPVLHGDYVGQAQITNVFPGDQPVAVIKWPAAKVPNPDDFSDPDARHFCLLARFTSTGDPMSIPEGNLTFDNTKNNNNIAWHNISILKPGEPGSIGSPIGPVQIGSVANAEIAADFGFMAELGEDRRTTILDYAEIRLTLPAELYKRWLERGGEGTGIRRLDDQRTILITSRDAIIRNLHFSANEQATARVEVVYRKKDPTDRRIFRWHMIQFQQGRREPIGGETYQIYMSDREDLHKEVTIGRADLSNSLELSVHPNPTHSSATIGYTLPEETHVGISLYDASGKLVRTLMQSAPQDAGRHTIEWDGASAGGEQVPNGVYFYRIETMAGSAQGQIVIAR